MLWQKLVFCTLTDTQTIRHMDRQTDRLIPVYPQKHLFCRGIMMIPDSNKVEEKRIKMQVTSIFSFFLNFFKSFFCQDLLNKGLCEKGLKPLKMVDFLNPENRVMTCHYKIREREGTRTQIWEILYILNSIYKYSLKTNPFNNHCHRKGAVQNNGKLFCHMNFLGNQLFCHDEHPRQTAILSYELSRQPAVLPYEHSRLAAILFCLMGIPGKQLFCHMNIPGN